MSVALVFVAAVAAIFLLVVGLVAAMYNGLVRVKNACDESWADIDTELRRRYDLIPNLIESVKGYAKHEQETFDKVIQARNAALAAHTSVAAQAQDENVLASGLRQLFALAENYPDLKANQNFLQLQNELANTEDRLQRARRFYNANVRDLNNRLEVFPSNVIAQTFGFTKREYFELDDAAQREAPKVSF